MANQRRLIRKRIYQKDYEVIKDFEVVKPFGDDWYNTGRKYNEKGIATFYHQNSVHPKFDFSFEPPELKSEIESLIKTHITERPNKLEQTA